MLSRLRLQNFKSFVDQEIELGPLVIMVGANASGKSNFLDAIRFLQGIGLGMTFTEILRGRWEGGREIWPGIRGGIQEIARKGHSGFSLSSTWEFEPTGNQSIEYQSIAHQIETGGLFLWQEHLWSRGSDLIREMQPAVGHAPWTSAVHRLTSARRNFKPALAPETEERFNLIASLVVALEKIKFLDITPTRMRGYVARATDQLGSEGENLSAIVFQQSQSQDEKNDLVDWLSELVAPELVGIDFVETDLGDVMLELVEPGGTKIPARSLSDGTLRFLGLLVALRTAEPGSILLIEEVDSGLHPQRVHLLVEALDTATRERGIQLIATTHSPLVLGALPEKALHDAVLCARSPEEQGTVLRRLGDLPHFDEIAERRGADYLMATGWLERAL